MGDHRANIKIEFEFHDKTYRMNSWINWSPSDSECPGLDQRVIDFFRDATIDGMDRFYEEQNKYEAEQKRIKLESEERATLARLKAKYEAQA